MRADLDLMSGDRMANRARGNRAVDDSDAVRLARVCVDVTDLLSYASAHPTISGIQRVILKVLCGFVDAHGLNNVDIIRFDEKRGVFRRASAVFFDADFEYDQEDFCAYFGLPAPPNPQKPVDLKTYVQMRYAKKPFKKLVSYARLFISNHFSKGRSFSKRNIIIKRVKRPRRQKEISWRDPNFVADDRVLILGATWNVQDYAATILKYKHGAGFKVYQMVHDLIPVITPEHVSEEEHSKFEKYVDNVLALADVIVANSQSTAKDLDRYALAKHLALPPIAVVPLAHEFFLGAPRPVERQPLRMFNDRNYRLPEYSTARILGAVGDPYVLVVGTIESRKNILRLIRVWSEIYLENGPGTPKLVLAGKPGFGSDDVWKLLNATGNLYGKIVFVDRPDDGEVAFLYANCLFSLCLSYYEGWGLPVGESLWFGRPVLASKASSLPEVGGDLIDYCDPYDEREIGEKLCRLIFNETYRRERADAIQQARLRTWGDVLADLWGALRIDRPRMK